MKMQALSKSLQGLIGNLLTTIEKEGQLTPLRCGEIVKAANIAEEDLVDFADFDHPIEDCYGRKLVFDNGNFEVMVMSWNPMHYSSIHNHGHTQGGVVQVFGNAHHMVYHVKENQLRFSKREILNAGGVVKVNNKFVHQMGNSTCTPYMSLHVYGCNDRDENITSDAKNFDLEFDRISHTTGGAFFNLPASAIYDFEKGPEPTNEVFLHYAYLLLSYYNRQPQTQEIKALQKNVLNKIEGRLTKQKEMELTLMDN